MAIFNDDGHDLDTMPLGNGWPPLDDIADDALDTRVQFPVVGG
ncbi:MAG: hypothetical protein WBM58_00010 [Sedimenticolaceae bacterium]